MKNKKGFTLIEIIGAVIILGIIAIIAFNTFIGNLKGFRDDYYNNIVRTLSSSGKEFFNDNRNYRPNGILGAQKVSLGMLESKGYLDEVVDYKGKTCDKSNSYVLVVKEGKSDYSYHACLKCLEDNFDNTSDMYCDPAWLDPNAISYGIGEPPELFVYLGTSKEVLKEKLEIPISYVRKNNEGEVIRSVRGTPEEGLPTILPDNIDVVDTTKIGVYQVTYSFKPVRSGIETGEVEITPGTVTVYENASPGLAIIYSDVVAQSGATLASIKGGSTETQTGIYTSDTWHQNITVTLSSTAFVEPDVEVARYQWNKDGRWQDFCVTNATCQVNLNKDMNETIQFRMIDTNGHISSLTNPVIIKRDDTSPYCELETSGTQGEGGWYIGDVDIEFAENKDLNSGTYAAAISGILLNNLDLSTAILNRTESKTTNTHTGNTSSVTYIGYAEDRAGNYTTCEVVIKKDDFVPEVTIRATRKGNGAVVPTDTWVNDGLNFTLTQGTIGESGATIYYCKDTNNTCTPTTSVASGTIITAYNTVVGEYYIRYKIVSGAGLESVIGSYHAKVDITAPTCSLSVTSGTAGTNPWYTSSSMTVTATFSDTGGSNVSSKGTIDSTATTYNNLTTYTLSTNSNGKVVYCYVQDVAGNTNKNSITIYKDDLTPTVTITAKKKTAGTVISSNTWSNEGLNFTLTAGTTGVSSYTIYYCKDTANTCNPTTSVASGANITAYNTVVGEYYIRYKIVSGAGLSSSVESYHAKVDTTAPTCSLSVTSGTAGTSPWYTSSSMTVTATFSDTGGSNVSSKGTIDSTSTTYNNLTTYTLSTNINGKVVYCYVQDVAGNTNKNNITIYKDDITPTVTISAKKKTSGTVISSNTWSNEGLNFTLTAGTTGVSGYTIYYCKDTANTCSPSTSVSSGSSITSHNTTEGEFYIRYKIVSGAGLSSQVGSYHAKVDVTVPTCSISANKTGWTNGDVILTVSGTDSLSGLASSPYSWTDSTSGFSTTATSTKTSNGTYTAYVKDNAGNVKSCDYTITNIDKTNPTCSLEVTSGTAGSNGWYTSDSVTVTATFSDTGGSSVASKGTTTSSTASYNGETTYTISSNTTGTTIYCYVKDSAGNTGSNSKTIKKDNGSGVTCSPTGGNSSWLKTTQVSYGYKATGSVSGCAEYTGSTETISSSCEYSTWVSIGSNSIMKTHDDGPKYLTANSGARIKCDAHTFNIYADNEKPTCSISANTTSLTNGNVTLTVTGTDGSGSGLNTNPYSWDGSTYNSTRTKTVSSNGTYKAYVKDAVGNVGECSYTVSNIDKTAPTCSLEVTSGTAGSNGWYKSTPVIVTATFSDTGGSGVASKGTTTSSTTSYNGETTYTISSNTTGITVYCYVKDGVGNTGSNSKTIKIDDGAGATCTTGGGNSTWKNTDQVNISGGLSTTPISGCQEWDEGNASVSSNCVYRSYVNINSGQAIKTYNDGSTGGFSFTTNSGVSIMCRNNTWNIYADRQNPSCSISANKTDLTNGNVTLTVTGSDGSGSGVASYSWDGSTYSSTRTKTVSSNATYTAYVKDAVGNVGSCSYKVSNIDKTPPTCSFNYDPAPPAWTNSELGVKVSINRYDNVTPSNQILIHYNQAGTSGTTTTWNQIYWQNTSQAYLVQVEDEAGNIGSCYLNVTNVDRTEPTCTATSEPASWAQSVTITVEGYDGQSGMANPGYRWGGTEYTNTTSKTFTTESANVGGSNVTIGVLDNAGNGGRCTGKYYVDRTKPTCGATGSLSGDSTSMTVTINASDALSGLAASPYSWTSSSSGFDTSNTNTYTENKTIYYYVKDKAGNVATCSFKVSGILKKCAAGKYRTSANECVSCAKGSYSAAGSTSCTACEKGMTTSSTGSVTCRTTCPNATGVNLWYTPSWSSSSNTVNNLCKVLTCQTGYKKSGNECVPQ